MTTKQDIKTISFFMVIEATSATIKGLIKEVKDTKGSMTMKPADVKNPKGICKDLMEFYRDLPTTNNVESNIFNMVKIDIQIETDNIIRLYIDGKEVSARKYDIDDANSWHRVMDLLRNHHFNLVFCLNTLMNGTLKFELINSFKGITLK